MSEIVWQRSNGRYTVVVKDESVEDIDDSYEDMDIGLYYEFELKDR